VIRSVRLGKSVRAAVAVACVAGAAVAVSVGTAGAASTGLVINEVYGGGGNSGATFTNDFIEISNRGSSSASVAGDSVQYHSSGATGSWQTTPLSGTIPAGGIYLVAESQGTGGSQPLPGPQATGMIAMSATAGTVALVNGTTALTCTASAACESASIDLVGYGTAALSEGSPATGASNTQSASRTDAADSDNNSADFTAADPTPGAANAGTGTGTGTGNPPPTAGPLRIHDIQGTSFVSPDDGTTVTNVPGIVTGIRSSGSSKGYWIQDPAPDDNPATSEGIFVFTSSPTVAVGDSVLVSGTVKDFYALDSGETTSTTSNLSVTEIDDPTATVLSHDNPLPAAEVITPTTVPDTYAPDLGGANIESTPIQPARSALDFWESREGMRVEVDNARVVGPSDSFGEQYVTTKPAQDETIRGGTELLGENQVPSGRLEVVANDGSNPEVNVGDVFTGATVGPIDYSEFGGYFISATQLGTVKSGGIQPTVATPQTKKQLAVATYNVENLAATDPQSKFDALAKGIVTNLSDPDIVALEEIQDNDGAKDDGVVDSSQTINKLLAAITAAGGPNYASQEVDPVNDQDGGEPGGNIRQVFLYNPQTVTFALRGPSSTNRSTTGTQVVKSHGEPDLTLSPGRIDPTNPVWTSSRKPLVGEFIPRKGSGDPLFVIANHLDAKLGDQSEDGRFQFPAQSSATQRAGQAEVEHQFVQQLLNIDPKANVVVLGDLNDYQFSPSLNTLVTGSADGSGTPILSDLIDTLPVNQQYTYDFDGVSEVLDHILTTKGIKSPVYQVVHINAEFANQTSDHDPQVVRFTP
jgi:predicted extracellular nuclease